MVKPLFSELRKEIRRDYGFSRKDFDFIPFEDWRAKLKNYPEIFSEEYNKDLPFLKRKFGFDKLKEVKNKNKRFFLFSGIPGAGKTTLSNIIKQKVPNTILLRGQDIVDFLELYGNKKEIYRRRLRKMNFQNPDPWYVSYLYQDGLTSGLLKKGYNVVFDDHIRTRVNRKGYYGSAIAFYSDKCSL